MLKISNGTLTITLHAPDSANGYYRGTRFDWAGAFESIYYRKCNYCEPWFESYSPTAHDAICGPAEEFSPIGFESTKAGYPFLKIGVGILERPDDKPYDRFRLHRIIDEGKRLTESSSNFVRFTHIIESKDTGYSYEYIKEIELVSKNGFAIKHSLRNTGTKILEGDVYNHNFFTLGLLRTGPSRKLRFPFTPDGNWREDYSEVKFTEEGIIFEKELEKGQSVFSGNIHKAGKGFNDSPNSFFLSEAQTGHHVKMDCDVSMSHAAFWAYHRIACIEPYIDFKIEPGKVFNFDIIYSLI